MFIDPVTIGCLNVLYSDDSRWILLGVIKLMIVIKWWCELNSNYFWTVDVVNERKRNDVNERF